MAENQEQEKEKRIRNEEFPQDFRMRYQVIIDDIKYIKSRQWAVTYYLLLLFAAIIGFYKIISPEQVILSCWLRCILFMVAVGVAVFGILFLNGLEKTLARYRERLIDDILPNLSDRFQQSEIKAHKRRFNNNEKWKERYTKKCRDFWIFTFYLDLMLVLGVFFIFYYFFLSQMS